MPNLTRPPRIALALIGILGLLGTTVLAQAPIRTTVRPVPEPFSTFKVPVEWADRFWADPTTKTLFAMEPKALAALVPTQAGFRFCRCPVCPSEESTDPLSWTLAAPEKLTCRRCGAQFPNDKYLIKSEKDKKVPEELIEVRPGMTQKYPYQVPDPEFQHREDERIYLAAKRDYETREYLSKAALYAAIKHRDDTTGKPDPAWSRLACTLILRFAQVYPNYALHFDQPNEPKYLQPAGQRPPYRRGYRTGKWDWLGSLDVPINLVIAYAIVRDTPALAAAGKLLDEPDPARIIEREFFLASAAFVLSQPEEYAESSLTAYRGLLAVARLLEDADLKSAAQARIEEFSRRGFYHDGFWRQGDLKSHRRVVSQLEGWLDPLSKSQRIGNESIASRFTILPLLREAGASFGGNLPPSEVQTVSWSPSPPKVEARRSLLLGGVGMARLSVGQGTDALDVELRGQDGYGGLHFQRQSIRLAVGGLSLLDDLDEKPMVANGWNLATASHNTVVIDGLNQRESFDKAREPAAGGSFVYFATDPNFQVATLDDPRAYPSSASRYRQTVIVSANQRSRYAVSVFEVVGGMQHDQIFHSRSGAKAAWESVTTLRRQSGSLLPASIPYLRNARVEDGRWFVQNYGEFREIASGTSTKAEAVRLREADGRGVRLHLLGDAPRTIMTARTPDSPDDKSNDGRASLVVRRRSNDGQSLNSTFVTLFEPTGAAPPLVSVGRVQSSAGSVLLQVETDEGVEYLFVNHSPGTIRSEQLPDGRRVETDGLALRIQGEQLILAGGSYATVGTISIRRERLTGKIVSASRVIKDDSRGWFDVKGTTVDQEPSKGRTLLIRHGDGISHGWTIDRVEHQGDGLTRIFVREEPGFLLDPNSGEAVFYQFPATKHPGPHDYSIPGLAR